MVHRSSVTVCCVLVWLMFVCYSLCCVIRCESTRVWWGSSLWTWCDSHCGVVCYLLWCRVVATLGGAWQQACPGLPIFAQHFQQNTLCHQQAQISPRNIFHTNIVLCALICDSAFDKEYIMSRRKNTVKRPFKLLHGPTIWTIWKSCIMPDWDLAAKITWWLNMNDFLIYLPLVGFEKKLILSTNKIGLATTSTVC